MAPTRIDHTSSSMARDARIKRRPSTNPRSHPRPTANTPSAHRRPSHVTTSPGVTAVLSVRPTERTGAGDTADSSMDSMLAAFAGIAGGTADIAEATPGSTATRHDGPTAPSTGTASSATNVAAQTPCRSVADERRRRPATAAPSAKTTVPLTASEKRNAPITRPSCERPESARRAGPASRATGPRPSH